MTIRAKKGKRIQICEKNIFVTIVTFSPLFSPTLTPRKDEIP
jgi:hypothetical protein